MKKRLTMTFGKIGFAAALLTLMVPGLGDAATVPSGPMPEATEEFIEKGRTTYCHEVNRPVLLNSLYGNRPTLGFADHTQQPGLLKHHLSETVHACRGGRPGRADHFIIHRIDRSHVVDKPTFQIDAIRQTLVPDALVRGIPARQHPAGEQQGFSRFPGQHIVFRDGIEINPP